jgi:hypothetical protein
MEFGTFLHLSAIHALKAGYDALPTDTRFSTLALFVLATCSAMGESSHASSQVGACCANNNDTG